ncbi:MAG: septation protein A [Pseudomonadota bacterium]|nr:septation protein A [Pseudomonadota bacterium]
MSKGKREPSNGVKLLIDVGPLVLFFFVNWWFGVFAATGAFMAAMMIAMILSQVRYGQISPLLWFSGAMVLLMGSVTLWLHNETFIKIKPTLYYALISSILAFGLFTGRPLLKAVLESAYPGLDNDGWRKITRNWALFFLFMAALNEAVWRNSTTDFWVGFKLWGAIPLTFVFALANVPMLLRHGLNSDEAKAVEPGPVE